jgi:hypothetical protein
MSVFASRTLDVLGVLAHELGKGLKGTRALVSNGLVLAASGEEHKGGEALDRNVIVVVGSAVHLSDHDVLVGRKCLAELLPNGCQSLAVTTPGGVELNKDILVILDDKLIKGIAHKNGDWAVVRGGSLLGLEVGTNRAIKNTLDELLEGFLRKRSSLVVNVSLLTLGSHDEGGREVLAAQAELGHTAEEIASEPRNADLVDELGGKLGNISGERRPGLVLSVTDDEEDIFEATINVTAPCGLSVFLKEEGNKSIFLQIDPLVLPSPNRTK